MSFLELLSAALITVKISVICEGLFWDFHDIYQKNFYFK